MRVQAQAQRPVGPDVSLLLTKALQQPQQLSQKLLGLLLAPAEGAPEVVPPLKDLMLLHLSKWLQQEPITQLLRQLAGQSAAGPAATSFQMSVHLKQLLQMMWRRLVHLPVGLRKVQQGVEVQGMTLQRAQEGPRQARGNAGGKTWQNLRRTVLPVTSRQPGKPQTTSMSYLPVLLCSSSVCCLQSQDHTAGTATPVQHPLTAAMHLLLLLCQMMNCQSPLQPLRHTPCGSHVLLH